MFLPRWFVAAYLDRGMEGYFDLNPPQQVRPWALVWCGAVRLGLVVQMAVGVGTGCESASLWPPTPWALPTACRSALLPPACLAVVLRPSSLTPPHATPVPPSQPMHACHVARAVAHSPTPPCGPLYPPPSPPTKQVMSHALWMGGGDAPPPHKKEYFFKAHGAWVYEAQAVSGLCV